MMDSNIIIMGNLSSSCRQMQGVVAAKQNALIVGVVFVAPMDHKDVLSIAEDIRCRERKRYLSHQRIVPVELSDAVFLEKNFRRITR